MITRIKNILSSVSFWFAINLLALAALLIFHFTSIKHSRPPWWSDIFAVSVNLLTGGAVSFLFYFLVVFIPERRKKTIIKTNLKASYLNIKRDILWQVVFASRKGGRSDISTDSETIDNLMDMQKFKDAFSSGREGNEGYYAFCNQMSDDTPEFREILLKFKMLAKQIEYILDNYGFEDQQVFDFLKRLEMFLMRMEVQKPGYDESKLLCNFIYELFSGWDMIEGYRSYDKIQKMIDDI